MSISTIGFIGLGVMGEAMCRNLARKPLRDEYHGAQIHRLPYLPAWTGKLNAAASFPAYFSPLWLRHIERVARETRSELIIARDLPMADPEHKSWPPFKRVLIIGAGTGNDLSRALQWCPPDAKIDAVEIDPVIQKIVDGWPARLDSKRARGMGLTDDGSMDAIIQAFIEDDLRPGA